MHTWCIIKHYHKHIYIYILFLWLCTKNSTASSHVALVKVTRSGMSPGSDRCSSRPQLSALTKKVGWEKLLLFQLRLYMREALHCELIEFTGRITLLSKGLVENHMFPETDASTGALSKPLLFDSWHHAMVTICATPPLAIPRFQWCFVASWEPGKRGVGWDGGGTSGGGRWRPGVCHGTRMVHCINHH